VLINSVYDGVPATLWDESPNVKAVLAAVEAHPKVEG
jgi:hypothetical protein